MSTTTKAGAPQSSGLTPRAAQPMQAAPWRDHVEQRLLTWRQRSMNKSGDMLALDDFMDKESLADLIDFVCDEWAGPPDALTDTQRIEHLERLMQRKQFQNNRRPQESVGSDLHMREGRCSLYVRDLFGNAIEAECGYGESVREAIDAAIAAAAQEQS